MPMRAPLYQFTIPLSNIMTTDQSAWLTLFTNEKGRFGQDMQITVGGVTYSNLALTSDDLTQTAITTSGMVFNQQVALRQVSNSSWTPPSAGTTYPSFSWSGVAQYPYGTVTTFYTSVNDNPTGPRYAFPWYANPSPLTNFPTVPLKRWRISYPLMTDADLATLENFFVSVQGRWISFSFTDPITGTPYSHVRFDDDILSIRYLAPNQSSVEVVLKQTYNS